MLKNIKLKIIAVLFVSTLALPTHAFFGAMMNMGKQMMGGMNPMKMMNPTQMMMQMCGSGMGQMASGAMNTMGSMMSMLPMGGGHGSRNVGRHNEAGISQPANDFTGS